MNSRLIPPRLILTAAFVLIGLLTAILARADDDKDVALARYVIEQSGMSVKSVLQNAASQYDGIIYQYELDDEKDRLVHEVKFINLDKNTKLKVKIDAKTGEVISEREKKLRKWLWQEKDDDIEPAKKLQSSGFSLLNAIAVLEAYIGDKPLPLLKEVELEAEQGVFYFEIEAEDEDGEQEWFIDIETQQLIPVLKRD